LVLPSDKEVPSHKDPGEITVQCLEFVNHIAIAAQQAFGICGDITGALGSH